MSIQALIAFGDSDPHPANRSVGQSLPQYRCLGCSQVVSRLNPSKISPNSIRASADLDKANNQTSDQELAT